MNKQVGERIKNLRSKAGYTQAELAEKVGFTSQTVSNWESGSREPDIEALVKLSSLFNVSLDYLLSGKEPEEKVVIMSRIEMAAKKDDPSIIQDLGWETNYKKDENGYTIMDYVMKYNAKKVFEVIFNSCSHQSHFEVIFNCKHFNSAQNKNLKIIEYLVPLGKELEYARQAGIGEIRLLNEFTPAFLNQRGYGSKGKDEMLESYKSIFKYLVENYSKLSEERRNYYFGLKGEKATRQNCWSYAFPYFADYALKAKNYSLFEEILRKMGEGLEEKKARAEEMRRQGYYDYQINEHNRSHFIERPLEETYQYAMENGLFKEARAINSVLEKEHTEKEIKLAEMKASKDVSIKDRLIYEFTRDYLLNYNGLFNSNTVEVKGPTKEENKDKYLENLLMQYKDLYAEILKECPVTYLELAYRGVASKNLNDLYKFAVDNSLNEVERLIVNGDTQALLSYLRKLMILKGDELSQQQYVDGNRHGSRIGVVQRTFENNRSKPGEHFYLEQSLKEKVNQWYSSNQLFVDVEVPEKVEDALKFFDEYKEKLVTNWADGITRNIESIQLRRKNEAEYNRIKAEITPEYLKDHIDKGDEEKATIKLCVRLESILKHKFHYEGDLFTMLDSFFSNQMAFIEAFKPYDDEDNFYQRDMDNYYKTVELNEKHEQWTSYLSKLRMKRNSIVHSEKTNVSFTKDDLIACINIVEAIDKGE